MFNHRILLKKLARLSLLAMCMCCLFPTPSQVLADARKTKSEGYRIVSRSTDKQGVEHLTFESEYQSAQTVIRILKPPARLRAESDGAPRHMFFVLPVVAGKPGRWGDGIAEVLKGKLHERYNLVVVAPQFSALPWFCDHATDKQKRQESYLLKAVLPIAFKEYPVPAKHRLLIGFSKSGWGPCSLLFRNPDQFAAAVAWDAPFMKAKSNQFGMGPIFGTQANFEKYQLTRLVANADVRFTKQKRFIIFGYGGFCQHHLDFHEVLKKANIKHDQIDDPKRKHHWLSGWVPEAVAKVVELAR